MWRTGITAPRSAPSPWSAPGAARSRGARAGGCSRSRRPRATSPASVLRKPVTPARAVFERIRFGIGWRTEIEVIATTRPHPCACMAGTAAWHMAIVDRRVELERLRVGVDVVDAGEVAGGRPAGVRHQDVDPAERLDAPRRRSRSPPPTVPTSATSGTASAPIRSAAASTVARSRPQIATRTPSAASACAAAKPSPFDAAATAARFPAIPRSIGRQSRAAAAGRTGAQKCAFLRTAAHQFSGWGPRRRGGRARRCGRCAGR